MALHAYQDKIIPTVELAGANQLWTYPTLYKKDTKGKLRIWFMQRNMNQFRTVSGLEDGEKVTSEWRDTEAKSQDSADEQAHFNVLSRYEAQLTRSYHLSKDTVDEPIKFDPMLAASYKEFPGACFSQPKLDGVRAICTAEGFVSRAGKPLVACPHILEELAPFFEKFPDAILDGEFYNHALKEDFEKIISCVKQKKPTQEDFDNSRKFVQYWVYDLPSHEGTFSERFLELHTELADLAIGGIVIVVETEKITNTSISVNSHTEARGEAFLDELQGIYLEAGYEGQMVRLDTPYENKRTKALLKRKEFIDEEFEIVSINEGEGNWSNTAKSITYRHPDGVRTFNSGIKGNREFTDSLWVRRDNPPKIGTVKYFRKSAYDIPIFPVTIKVWDEEKI